MTEVYEARVEAAAKVFFESQCGPGYETSYYREEWSKLAKRALAAADEVVTVEQIMDEFAGHPIGSGYYQTTVSVDEARELAKIAHRLYRGEAERSE